MTERQLKKFANLSRKIDRLRTILNDSKSPPHLIEKPKHHRQDAFQRRIAKLQSLEVQRLKLLREMTSSES